MFTIVGASILVISAKNPVHSVLFLIVVFLNMTGILLILTVEFIAIIFVIIYLGAIGILFIFVVMLININIVELSTKLVNYLPLGAIIAVILMLEINWYRGPSTLATIIDKSTALGDYIAWNVTLYNPINVIGNLIYTYYMVNILIASLILLLGLIGTIVLLWSKGGEKLLKTDYQPRTLSRIIEIK